MKFMAVIERDEDGKWVIECPSIPGCVSQGDTRDEALANIREAIAACLEVRLSPERKNSSCGLLSTLKS